MDSTDFTIERPPDVGPISARLFAPAAPVAGRATLVLAHGAGAPRTHPFMVAAATALAARGLAVVTFNFPYMDQGRKVPDRAPVLERAWTDVIGYVAAQRALPRPLVIGGKSMGGRMASHVVAGERYGALALPPAGVVFLGYPLHPPGKPEQRRDAHLATLGCPALFVQGTRDAFGTPEELAPVLASMGPDHATLHVVEHGDHSFSVPRASGRRRQDVLDEVWDTVSGWIAKRAG